MKTRLIILLLGLSGVFGFFNTQAAVNVSVGLQINAAADFYEPLTPYGSWVEVGSYGRCWHPARVEADWQPYTVGHWEWTDVGWYWVSDEQWAWATYHYGYWVNDSQYGWCWIPGTEWAPSWVTWRESDDYIGWAPYAPAGVVIAPTLFVFIDVHHFHDHFRPNVFIRNDTRIIQKTKIVNNFRHENRDFGGRTQRIAVNEGPSVQKIQSATGTTFKPQPVQNLIQQTPVPETLRQRQSDSTRSGSTSGATQSGKTQPGAVQSETRTTQPGSVEQSRERTGREQQQMYQQSPVAKPEPKQTERREPAVQSPVTQPERRSEEITPREPASRPEIREPQRAPREVPSPNAERREVPAPAAPERITPQIPAERPLPPTGREKEVTVPSPRPEVIPPRQAPAPVPARPQAVPPGQDKERDKEHP
ncbi:MAG: hypothetical protein QOD03_576 [Verrucomicrobiota bacterium]